MTLKRKLMSQIEATKDELLFKTNFILLSEDEKLFRN